VNLHGDWAHLNINVSAGNKNYYIKNNTDLELSEDTYTKIYWRYICGNGSINARIVLEFDNAQTQEVLAETNSTTWSVGSATIQSAAGSRELDHIYLYANDATGDVYYDFILVCKGAFTFPNIVSIRPRYRGRSVELDVPGKGGDTDQNLATKDTLYDLTCDLSVGTWTRTGDNKDGDVFRDIHHERHDEPWQWFDWEEEQIKAKLLDFTLPKGGGEEIASFSFKEKNVCTRNNEFWYQRFGTDL
jgi:hypothetical protein